MRTLPKANDATIQRAEWRVRLVAYLLPRLTGTDGDKETALEMLSAGVREAHGEGLMDAAYMLDRMQAAMTGEAARVLGIAAKAMRELKRRNDASEVEG